MELDDLKIFVKQNRVRVSAETPLPPIKQVIRKRSGSVIRRIKQSLQMEFFLAVFFVSLIVYIIIQSGNIYFQVLGCFMLLFCLCFIYYIIQLYRKIVRQESTGLSIKENLQHLISVLAEFTRLYFQLTMVMLPVCFLAGLAFGYINRISNIPGMLMPVSAPELLIYTAGFAVWSAIMYFFTRWYVKKLYGDHLDKLRNQLIELTNEG